MLFLFASALLATAAPGDSAPAAGPAPAAKPVKEKKVCRSDVSTGSIMPKTTCKTQSEWDALGAANRGAREQMTDIRQTDQSSLSGNR